MITVAITTNLADLEAAVKRATATRPAMIAIAEVIRAEALRNFREGGRWPAKWPVSRRAAKEGGKTLLRHGTLRNSITATATDTTAEVGTALKYAGIHQYGGELRIASRGQMALKGKFVGFQRALAKKNRKKVSLRIIREHTIHMPARPFLPISSAGELSPDSLRRAANTVAKHIAKGNIT